MDANILFRTEDLEHMEQRFRTSFINSLSGFKSIALIGTMNPEGQHNLAVFNSLVHIGASPALMGIIVRPDSADRHTLNNIRQTGFYTINHIHSGIYRQAHQTSARYPENSSEFEATGLTPVLLTAFPAPFVAESRIRLGMELADILPIPLNGTHLVIGKIIHISVPENCICSDGYLDIEKAGSLTGTSLDGYHKTSRLERLTYAKPNQSVASVELKYRS